MTVRHRLHLGVGAGVGNGGEAGLLAEAFGEAGIWLHASARVDLLLGWRLSAARFSIYGMPVHAAMTSSLIELRYRARPNLDVVIQPFTLTGYYNGLWAIVAGPALGAWPCRGEAGRRDRRGRGTRGLSRGVRSGQADRRRRDRRVERRAASRSRTRGRVLEPRVRRRLSDCEHERWSARRGRIQRHRVPVLGVGADHRRVHDPIIAVPGALGDPRPTARCSAS